MRTYVNKRLVTDRKNILLMKEILPLVIFKTENTQTSKSKFAVVSCVKYIFVTRKRYKKEVLEYGGFGNEIKQTIKNKSVNLTKVHFIARKA